MMACLEMHRIGCDCWGNCRSTRRRRGHIKLRWQVESGRVNAMSDAIVIEIKATESSETWLSRLNVKSKIPKGPTGEEDDRSVKAERISRQLLRHLEISFHNPSELFRHRKMFRNIHTASNRSLASGQTMADKTPPPLNNFSFFFFSKSIHFD